MSEQLSFSFSDPEAGLHCFGRGAAVLAFGAAADARIHPVSVVRANDHFEIAIAGVCDALLEPLGQPIDFDDGQSNTICRLGSQAASDRTLDGFGCVSLTPPGLGRLSLRRNVWTCFGPELAFALLAERPARKRAHGDERVAAFVARGTPLEAHALEDPRLSTTYRNDGQITRAGLELWEPSDDADAEPHDRARALRIGGETIAAAELTDPSGPTTSIAFLEWHHDGHQGIGCYTIERLQ